MGAQSWNAYFTGARVRPEIRQIVHSDTIRPGRRAVALGGSFTFLSLGGDPRSYQ